ncbi:MAG: class I SAM-dependent methyltransferase [Saprospiraceae bacterium]|nr:class I SAM-dependent methyltransferase [Saprospiraceae bacterium]
MEKTNDSPTIWQRYPPTDNHTLQAWNAADEFLVSEYQNSYTDSKNTAVFHDRFGFLSGNIDGKKFDVIVYLKSQQKAIRINTENKGLGVNIRFLTPFDEFSGQKWEVCIIHLPKSIEMWEIYLKMIHRFSDEKVEILTGFMTRHFTENWMEVAKKYFYNVRQSKAWKKARLMTLSGKKEGADTDLQVKKLTFRETEFYQYPGVFSKDKIDDATRFLLENISLKQEEKTILDWGCGNGVIGKVLTGEDKDRDVYYMDDNIMATESVRQNIINGHIFWEDDVSLLKNVLFDIIITNPPFHFEYENDITVSLRFFEKASGHLKKGGRLIVVANRFINYKTHLVKWYEGVQIVAENEKFVVYECQNTGLNL